MSQFLRMTADRVRFTVALAAVLVCVSVVGSGARLAVAEDMGQDTGAAACPGTAPAANWLCINGGWVPADHPLAAGAAPVAPPVSVPTPPPPSSLVCSTPSPVPGWVCVNDGWVPPDHPLAVGAVVPPSPTSPPPPASAPAAPSACDFPQPAADWVCANGEWLPPDYPGLPTPGVPDTTGAPVPFSVIATTYWSGLETPERVVVRDQALFDSVWAMVFAQQSMEPPPTVDFASEMVIVVSQGLKPSGGFSIDVVQITEAATEQHVVVRSTSPGAFCAVAGALTWPTQVVRLPRYDGDVQFVEERLIHSCE